MKGFQILDAVAHDHDYIKQPENTATQKNSNLHKNVEPSPKTNKNTLKLTIANNKPALTNSIRLSTSSRPKIRITRSDSYKRKSGPKSPAARIVARRSSILSTPCGSRSTSPFSTVSPLSDLSSSCSNTRSLSESSSTSSMSSFSESSFSSASSFSDALSFDDAFEAIFELQENIDLRKHVQDYLSKNVDPVLSYVETNPGFPNISQSVPEYNSSGDASLAVKRPRLNVATLNSRRTSVASSHGYFSGTDSEMDDLDFLRDSSDITPTRISKLWNLSLDNFLFNDRESDKDNLSFDKLEKDITSDFLDKDNDNIFNDINNQQGLSFRCE